MKLFRAIAGLVLLAGCDRSQPPPPPKPTGISDIESPKTSTPPVQALSYDDGYKSGDAAGDAAARAFRADHPKQAAALPFENELDVVVLQAAGTDITRGQKWQRGFAAGYRDGFQRIAEGKRLLQRPRPNRTPLDTMRSQHPYWKRS